MCNPQELQEKDHQLEGLRAEYDEVHAERKRNSITASDMGGEVARLKKVGRYISIELWWKIYLYNRAKNEDILPRSNGRKLGINF